MRQNGFQEMGLVSITKNITKLSVTPVNAVEFPEIVERAYNTAMIINSLIANAPVQTSQSISGIPVLYSKVTLKTVDSY